MKKPFVTYNAFDVITTPFPFADRNVSIVRPVVILTDYAAFGQRSGVAIVAMITSAKHSGWPFDVPISDLESAGLRVPCVVRAKLNAVAFNLMDRKIGSLSLTDRGAVGLALSGLFGGVL
jgi:mRNA interferase MazF